MSLPIWPKDKHEHEQYFGHFLLHLADFIKIDFDSLIAAHPEFALQNPQQLLRAYLLGNISSDVYQDATNSWWDLIYALGITRFGLTNIHARMALILVGVADTAAGDDAYMNELLGWIYELMNILSTLDKRFSYPEICSHMNEYFKVSQG